MYIYQSIIQPIFDYAITIWGFTFKYNLSKVQRLQDRAARIITGDFDYAHVGGIDVNNVLFLNYQYSYHYLVTGQHYKT